MSRRDALATISPQALVKGCCETNSSFPLVLVLVLVLVLEIPSEQNRYAGSIRSRARGRARARKDQNADVSPSEWPNKNHYGVDFCGLAGDSGDESFQTVALRMVENLSRRTFFFNSPLVQKDNMAGNIAGETHLMSHHDHCAPL